MLTEIENLVFSAGGMRGMAFVGTLKELERRDLLKNVHRFAGSSAGALCAGALACGATPDQLENMLKNVDPKIFSSHGFGGAFRKLCTLLGRNGIYRTKEFRAWIKENLIEICGNAEITFDEVYQKFQNELVITGTTMNPTPGETVYFSRQTGFGSMKIAEAMMISCCIPFYFQTIKYQGGTYIDGGILDFCPTHIFDRQIFGGDNCTNDKTLGISLIRLATHGNFVPPYYEVLNHEHAQPRNLFDFIYRMLNSIYYNSQWSYERSVDNQRTVQIDTSGFNPLKFNLSTYEQNLLISRGEVSTNNLKNSRTKFTEVKEIKDKYK